jgi:hypothetical protein
VNFVYDPSLVFHLPLYELDGDSFISKDACGHLCTVTGAVWTPRGSDFDGLDDKITVPDHSSLCPAGAMTLEFWLFVDSFPSRITPVAKWGDAGYRSYTPTTLNAPDTDKMRLYLSANGSIDINGATTPALGTDRWHHLVFTFDGTLQESSAFVDGRLVDTTNRCS